MIIYHYIRIMLAAKLPRLQKWLLTREETRQLHLLKLRVYMAEWGFDVSDMTDEEIMEGIKKFGEALSSASLSARQAGEAMRLFAVMMKGLDNSVSDV